MDYIIIWNRCVDFYFDCGGGFDFCYVMSLRSRWYGWWWFFFLIFVVIIWNWIGIGWNSGGFYDYFWFYYDFMWGVLIGFFCDGGKGNVWGNLRVEMVFIFLGLGYRRWFFFNGFGGGFWWWSWEFVFVIFRFDL